MSATSQQYAQLDAWIDAHFDEQVKFLQALVQVPTDTPPGNNAPHAERTAELLAPMGFEAENNSRMNAFQDWMVDEELMAVAKPDALFMHCLPAHRGEEVSAGVIDGPQSIVWEEAENRLHVQKALMEYLLCGRLD